MNFLKCLIGMCLMLPALVYGQGNKFEGPGSGKSPFDDETWIVLSKDGIAFPSRQARFVTRHASVPDLIVLPDGRWIIYYVDFSDFGPGRLEKISAHISTDSGFTWKKVYVAIDGKADKKAVDPDAVRLDDGRIRLYYFASIPGKPGGPEPSEKPHNIYSAISDDGIYFFEEPGIRFTAPGITDPDVIRLPDGSWRMHCARPFVAGRSGLVFAASRDGLTFVEDTTAFIKQDGIPGSVVLPDGRVRLFLNGKGGMATYLSDVGHSFIYEGLAFEGMGIADPSPCPLADGSYALVYKKMPAPKKQKPPPNTWQQNPPPTGNQPPYPQPPPRPY